ILLTLDAYTGLVRADADTGLVTLRGGTRLWEIGPLLAPHGLALAVMGDIDQQSIAGAIQTGTHGTGAAFTGFAGQVAALLIALPDGSIVDACPHSEPELFAAAQLGLGAIGVICEVTLQCVPAYRLELTESTQDLEQTVTSFLADASAVDHHEFFWFPRTRRADAPTAGSSCCRPRCSAAAPSTCCAAVPPWCHRSAGPPLSSPPACSPVRG